MTTRTKIDPRLRADFKEQARDIIARDRLARKYGRSQSAIGEIERHLAAAFQLGLDRGSGKSVLHDDINADELVEWNLLPPRARDVLWSINLRLDKPDVLACGHPTIRRHFLDDKERWTWGLAGTRMTSHSFSAGGVKALVKFALLEAVEGKPDLLRLTTKGVATCRDYSRRAAMGDRSLPKMSLRV